MANTAEDDGIPSGQLVQPKPGTPVTTNVEDSDGSSSDDEADRAFDKENPQFYKSPKEVKGFGASKHRQSTSWVWDHVREMTPFHNHKTKAEVHVPTKTHVCCVELLSFAIA
jgi:hypothetical protein